MSTFDTSSLMGAFFDEAEEHLVNMEESLLALEHTPDDRGLLDAVFRAAHSIKGGCGVFGFNDVLRFTHALENLLQRVREGRIAIGPLTELLLRAKDVVADLVVAARDGGAPPEAMAEMLGEIEEVTPAASIEASHDPDILRILAMSAVGGGIFSSAPPAAQTYTVRFEPAADVLAKGLDPVLALEALAELGAVSRVALDDTALPSLDDLDPGHSYLRWSITLCTNASESRIRDVFAFFDAPTVVEVEKVTPAVPALRIIEVPEAPREAVSEPTAAEVPVAAPAVAPPVAGPTPKPAPDEPVHAAEAAGPAQRAASARPTVRVDTEKIDKIINLVGELIIAHSIVTSAMTDGSQDATVRLRQGVTAFGRSMRELQDRVLSVRMVPIGTVFNRFPRMVRDTAGALGKQIEFVTEGGATELDKAMVEKIVDPLTHLVRNAVDHGIESPTDRKAAGKSEEGRLVLRAFHQGGSVVIEIRDDGRGLDTERIRRKAVSMGLLAESAVPTEEELHALIFAPGLSTAQKVSDVSGRGVGMDVVKSNIESLNGTVRFTSKPGEGCKVTVRLPLTMAIMDGLSVRIADQIFVLPLSGVVESFRPKRDQVHPVLGSGEVVRARGETIPLIRPATVLGVDTDERDPSRAIVCILDAGLMRVALLVDELVGQTQAVVRPLEQNYRRIDGVMGATVLGDGGVALILDIAAIARLGTASHFNREKNHGSVGLSAQG